VRKINWVDSPHIAESGREVSDNGAAEEIDLFEGGHFGLFWWCSDDQGRY